MKNNFNKFKREANKLKRDLKRKPIINPISVIGLKQRRWQVQRLNNIKHELDFKESIDSDENEFRI